MKQSPRGLKTLAVVGVAAVGVIAGGWWGYQRWYAGPMAKLQSEVRGYEAGLEAREDELMRAGPVRERLRRIAATTLGSDEETVSATLRSATNEILASNRLSDTRVSTSRPEGVRNPAATRVREFSNDRATRNAPDFFVVSATARGIGSFEEAMRTMATLQFQPWVHRIDQWTISPVDKERERFELSVEFSSIYFPERELLPRQVADARIWEPLSEARFTPYRSILAQAVFKAPPPPARPAPEPARAVTQTPPAPAAPPPPPYADWRLTGFVAGGSGEGIYLVNDKSGERAELGPGQSVLGAVFVEAEGETATVEIDGARYLVKLGETLADRLAVSR